MSDAIEFPIFDEEGEVLAADEAERREVMRLQGLVLVEEVHATVRANEARRGLRHLMRKGDAVNLGGGYALAYKPGRAGSRSVLPHKIDEHAEALAATGLGLAPREEPQPPKIVRPGVAQLTTKAARAALAQHDLTPEDFIADGIPTDGRADLIVPGS